MRKKQEEILYDIAFKHGLQKGQAKEIWKLLTDKAADTISDLDKKEEGFYIAEKFKTIHIQSFGKFIPNKKRINYANMCLKKKKENKDD